MRNYKKFYFVEFTYKKNNRKFYKFGITSYSDVMKRFDYPEYKRFNIRVIYSCYGKPELIEDFEEKMLMLYPKHETLPSLEGYLLEQYGEFQDFGGITECFLVGSSKVQSIKNNLLNLIPFKDSYRTLDRKYSFEELSGIFGLNVI